MQRRPPGELLRSGARAGVRLRRLVRSGAVSPWLSASADLLMAAARSPRAVAEELERLRSSSDELVVMTAQLFTGLLAENTGELDRAVEHTRRAWESSSRLGFDWIAGHAAQALANLASQDDRPEQTLEWAARARERLGLIGAVEEINQSDWTTAINLLKLGRRDGVVEAFERFVSDENGQQEGFDVFDVRAIGWAGLAEIAAADGRPDEAIELYRRSVNVYGSRPGFDARGAWVLISAAGAVAASVYLDRVDEQTRTTWGHLRIAARVELRQRGGAEFVDRPVLATAALGLGVGLLGFAQAADAQRSFLEATHAPRSFSQTADAQLSAAVDLLALAERMHSRQDQPMLVRGRAFALAEAVLGASAVAAARDRAGALRDLTECAARVDELLRVTKSC